MSDTATPPLLATRDALVRELERHIGAHASIVANDLLASGVLDQIRAEAWEQGAKAGHHSPLTWFALRQVNPYRAAALTEAPS